jgi:hypothetical protein
MKGRHMQKHHFPISVYASPSLRTILKSQTEAVAGRALNEILKQNKSLEIAHQQFRWGSTPIVFSSRVSQAGYLIIDMDIGDERLSKRIVFEDDLRSRIQAGRKRG